VAASNDLGGSCRAARVLIMFFQDKWAFRWARRWRRFHGVPRNHGNPVTPLSGHEVSPPRRAEGISGAGDAGDACNVAAALAFGYPNSPLLSSSSSSSATPGEAARARGEGEAARKGRETP